MSLSSLRRLSTCGAVLTAASLRRTVSAQDEDTTTIRIVTELGEIVAHLYADTAPVTVANFLRYVDAGAFDGSRFYRVVRADNQPDDSVKIAVVQGGIRRDAERYPPIPLERTSPDMPVICSHERLVVRAESCVGRSWGALMRHLADVLALRDRAPRCQERQHKRGIEPLGDCTGLV